MSHLVEYKLLVNSCDLTVGLYESIDNLPQIHELTQNEQNFCLINATMIFDTNQIFCAINKAINNKMNNKLITKRLNNEIVFSLSPSKNITESLKTFGVNNTDDKLPVIALVVKQTDQSIGEDIFGKISGNLLPIESLKNIRNQSLIDKVYKLKDCLDESAKWDLIMSKIATKDLI